MKTKLDTSLHEVVGSQETRNLRIDANGKAFKELISGIYSDKAYAIARETFANAVDAHVQAGTPDRPFDLKVPTKLDPEYLLRDYGVSMTHETVMELYSTLFRSTKDDPTSDDSNKFVGKFGLGSKSPFSYTDAFQLTAYLDGEARVYDIYFNGGVPQIALFARTETEEENGVLITFPVDPKDCADFERAIVRAAEGLPVVPNFIGRTPHLPHRNVISQGARWKLLDSTATGSAEAKQGTVLYPLNKHAVIDCPLELYPLFDLRLHLDFPIGELDVVTSREALSYDDETSANIIRALQEVRQDIRERAVAQLRKATTYHEFNVAFSKLKKQFTGSLWNLLDLDAETFGGKKRTTEYRILNRDQVVKTMKTIEKDGQKFDVPEVTRNLRMGDLEFHKITNYATSYYGTLHRFKDLYNSRYDGFEVDATVDAYYLFLEDMNLRPRYTQQRLDIIKSSKGLDGKNVECLWVRHTVDPTYAIKRFRASVGRAPVFVIHLKDVPFEVKSYYGDDNVYVPDDYKVIGYDGWASPNKGAEAPEAAYYVPLYKGDVEGVSVSTRQLDAIKKQIVAAGEPDLPIIGIPKTKRSQIKKNAQWIEFVPKAREVLAQLIDKETLTAFYVKEEYTPQDIHKTVVKLRNLLREKLFTPLVEGTSIPVMFDALDHLTEIKLKASNEPSNVLNTLHRIGGTSEVADEARKDANAILGAYYATVAQVGKDFGLLQHLSIPTFKDRGPVIVDFVEEKKRRLACLPFYSWLKSLRPAREIAQPVDRAA